VGIRNETEKVDLGTFTDEGEATNGTSKFVGHLHTNDAVIWITGTMTVGVIHIDRSDDGTTWHTVAGAGAVMDAGGTAGPVAATLLAANMPRALQLRGEYKYIRARVTGVHAGTTVATLYAKPSFK